MRDSEPIQVPSVQEVRRRLSDLDHQDMQLWSIYALIALALTAGLAAVVAPNLGTGIRRASGRFNRDLQPAYLDQILASEVRRADRRGTSLAIGMIDLDNFKSINTRFGHQTGDRILCEVARLLKRTFRGSDTVVRYGGDEFLLVMPETEEHEAHPAMKRLVQAVSEWNSENKAAGYEMSLSYGIATYKHGASLDQVMEAADNRMYSQRSMRHAKSTTMLDLYAQTDMDELTAAQELVLDAIFSQGNAEPVN